ncbi:hypothetical protein M422DRAFT_24930 [Sphaerobolus stellatus SS14]|nr:hypothetical protein M422DRAFT_24930 [Sphaerobolus stellatus SS14]
MIALLSSFIITSLSRSLPIFAAPLISPEELAARPVGWKAGLEPFAIASPTFDEVTVHRANGSVLPRSRNHNGLYVGIAQDVPVVATSISVDGDTDGDVGADADSDLDSDSDSDSDSDPDPEPSQQGNSLRISEKSQFHRRDDYHAVRNAAILPEMRIDVPGILKQISNPHH